ncbi:WXG100 family type VII secretion target [Micromonospora sp. NBC_01412]|uniref:WXG100 family type VII secretion target n=1 Tax=Micromonospora sp. NBC_01412 TaxID=2903590 RepID=UPI003247EA8E
MVSLGNALIFAAVKQMVEANAKIAKTAVLALVAVGSMAANPNDMSDAATAWKEMANDLTTFAAHLDSALGKGDDWTADDKDAFAASFTNFKGEIEQFKGAVSDIAGTLEMISNAYMVSFVALLAFAGACLVILIGLLALLVIPFSTAAAQAAITAIGLALTALSAKVAMLLAGLAAAVAAMFGAVAYGWVNIGSRSDSIPAALDFKKIQIDYEAPQRFEVKGD